MHGSTPPRSDSLAVGGTCSFDVGPPDPFGTVFDRLLLLPSPTREDRCFRFPFTRTGTTSSPGSIFDTGGVSTEFEGPGGPGVAGSSADGVAGVDTPGEAGVLRFSLFRLWVDHSPCIDLLSVFEPCLGVHQ